MGVTTVFPILEEEKIRVQEEPALKNIVHSPNYVSVQRTRGIEAPIFMQIQIREVLREILSTQSEPGWWKAMKVGALHNHPALSEWKDDPELSVQIHHALVQVSAAAADALWASSVKKTVDDAFHEDMHKGLEIDARTYDTQVDKLSKIAARELDSVYLEPYKRP